ncbi:hypothetical protein N181_19025 [Sinorhizobium fredii USDA 205]|uniref:Uncharacterized protein n=2 Tax=Rhizobium fredii TaxID=380 RepID=A0A2A6M0J2_RHIFR|nr:hypothetical protein [Sinorhizobium fredii]AWM26715.1 hypothetical protein AOX55_00003484 [Sinorhizobium fredii CCBAU 25509]KSV87241.1 hypothetical protein N181_19025 [Sinorhizobium fredii USDA 205]MCG5475592.1 hypothetical protein [Sinorhizobium fredii]MQW95050.1 hypothetical protein [Sinorhizobium fredii]MQX10562.1 hypothetical protein [Sinorhizobium fredii]
MARNSPNGPARRNPALPDEEEVPGTPRSMQVRPVVQGRVRPVRSRDEQNVDPDEALPNDEEEQSISDNLSREEVRFGEVKTPKPD